MNDQILAKRPSAKLRVYAIWLPMVPSDARSKWDGAILADPRVTHLWDGERVVGRWFAKEAVSSYPGDVAWDVYFLYGRAAHWERAPAPLVSWGRTIVKTEKKLEADILPLLSQ